MWIQSSKNKTWVNLDEALRIFQDGQNGWTVISRDGVRTQISDEDYNCKCVKILDPTKEHPTPPDLPNAQDKDVIKVITKLLQNNVSGEGKKGED